MKPRRSGDVAKEERAPAGAVSVVGVVLVGHCEFVREKRLVRSSFQSLLGAAMMRD